jgi:hypothetical protein
LGRLAKTTDFTCVINTLSQCVDFSRDRIAQS